MVAADSASGGGVLPGSASSTRVVGAGAKARSLRLDEIRAERVSQMPAGRFGTAEEFGELCAYLCSAQAGYITGQNMLIDGGAYPGTF